MIASDYIKKNFSTAKFKYVGTIYGNDEMVLSGVEIAELMSEMRDNSALIEHPANGGCNGFYMQSNDIYYHSKNHTECVFEIK